MRRVILLLVMLLLGTATAAIVAAAALYSADRAARSDSSIIVRNGTEAWLVRIHEAFGLSWVNCERALTPLVHAAPTVVDVPPWANPPEGVFPPESSPRVATLAVGWPLPMVTRQWSTKLYSQIFPLQFEIDDGNDSLRRAAERFREQDPAVPFRILWQGVLINVGVFTLAWGVLAWFFAAAWRAVFASNKAPD